MALFKYDPAMPEAPSDGGLVRLALQMSGLVSFITIISASAATIAIVKLSIVSQATAHAAIFIILSGGLTILGLPFRTIIELKGHFFGVNIIKGLSATFIPLSVFIPTTASLSLLESSTFYIFLSRIITLLFYVNLANFGISEVRALTYYDNLELKQFFSRAKFVGLTNLLSLILSYQDRFLLAYLLGSSQVAKYAAAYEFSSKIWLANGALTVAATPTVGVEFRDKRASRSFTNHKHLTQWKLLTISVVVVPTLIVIIACRPIMNAWLGTEHLNEIATISQILCFGMTINCVSQTNFSLLQLAGHEDKALKLQFFNSATAIIIGAALITKFGVVGAASAMSIRLVLDALICRCLLTRAVNHHYGFTMAEIFTVITVTFAAMMISV